MSNARHIRSTKVLRSAKGRTCTARFPGICNNNLETTVWAHLNGATFGKGMGIKAHDVLGFHACSDCHAYYDVGHGTKAWLDDATFLECVLSAVCETYVRLIVAGIVVVPQSTPTPSHAKPTPPRKPKEKRAPIHSRGFPEQSRPIQSRPFPIRKSERERHDA